MTITFGIRNITSELVKNVMLRKFFQMVFVGNDRKTLHIYTATVIGGSSESDCKLSCLQDLTNFCMKFGFIVTGNDDNEVLSIISENVTDGKNGMLSQVDCVRQVWGKQCTVINNNQSRVKELYKKLLENQKNSVQSEENEKKHLQSNKSKDNDDSLLSSIVKSRVLWIEDDDKAQEDGMMSMAIAGEFDAEDYDGLSRKKNSDSSYYRVNEGSEKAFYRVSVPENLQLPNGIELLTWVKTTIKFKHQIDDQNLIFCIQKEKDDNTHYEAPDFTWYFSPPVKSFINYESSSAEVRWKKDTIDSKACKLNTNCKCPLKPETRSRFATKRYENAINPVANKTTVNFSRWIDDEMIGYRQKYRIASKNILKSSDNFNELAELSIYIDTTDEHSRGNRQYILGLFISFALALGIDKTRLADAQIYFPFANLFIADTWWMMFIIAITLNILIRPPKSIYERRYIRWKKYNCIASIAWIICVFCIDKSVWITSVLNRGVFNPVMECINGLTTFNINYFLIPQLLFLLILGSNILYIVKNIKKYHDPVLSRLFGENIL